MSLVKCPECQREISESATACPHCGYALAARPTTGAAPTGVPGDRRGARKRGVGFSRMLAGLLLLLVLVLFALWYFGVVSFG